MHHTPSALVMLIGNRMDLRNDEEKIKELEERNEKMITFREGIEKAIKIKAFSYCETSAKNQQVKKIF